MLLPFHNLVLTLAGKICRQFKYVTYSLDDTMKKGPILGVILKQEYPPMIEGTSRAGHPIEYHASNWGHYSQIVRDDGQTPANRVKAEFWVSKVLALC